MPSPSPRMAASWRSMRGCSRPRPTDFPDSKINALVDERHRHLAAHGADTRHAADLLPIWGSTRHPGATAVYDDIIAKLVAARHPPAGDRRDRRRRHRRQEAGPLRAGPPGHGAHPARQHAEDGHRHECPEAPRRRYIISMPRGNRAEVEQRDGRILRQGNTNEEVAIYRYVTARRPSTPTCGRPWKPRRKFIAQVHDRRQHGPPGRGHRRPGALLRRGQSHRVGQPRRADAGRGRRRTAPAACPPEAPCRRAVPGPAPAAGLASGHHPAGAPPGRPHPGHRHRRGPCHRSGHHRHAAATAGTTPWRPWPRACSAAGHRLRDAQRAPGLCLAACALAWCSIRRALRRCPSRAPSRGRRHSPGTSTARAPSSTRSSASSAARQAERDKAARDLAIAQGQRRDYEARLGAAFAHAGYLAALTDLRNQLEAALSRTAQEVPRRRCLPWAALVERLKALHAAHTLEAAPERSAPRRTATVEEAITTRIRQREQAEAAPQPDDAPAPVAPPTPAPPPATAPAPPATPAQARPEPWTPPQQLRLF